MEAGSIYDKDGPRINEIITKHSSCILENMNWKEQLNVICKLLWYHTVINFKNEFFSKCDREVIYIYEESNKPLFIIKQLVLPVEKPVSKVWSN